MSRDLAGVLLSLALLADAGSVAAETSASSGALVESTVRSDSGRRVDLAIDPEAPITAWRSFAIVTPPALRSEGMAARDRDAQLRTAIAVAFGVAGFQHADTEAVDFVVEYHFAHPGAPPAGTTSWSLGKQTNWLEIRLRTPDDLNIVWRGRVYGVLRKKRNQRQQDEDAQLRFHAAAEAIIDAFRRSRGETF